MAQDCCDKTKSKSKLKLQSGPSLAARAVLASIGFYHKCFSGLTGRSCRFYPTCSAYMAGAVRRHGVLRGGAAGLWRILRCNPFSKGGHDPVPEQVFLAPAKRLRDLRHLMLGCETHENIIQTKKRTEETDDEAA